MRKSDQGRNADVMLGSVREHGGGVQRNENGCWASWMA
jgi:hypothetical protein